MGLFKKNNSPDYIYTNAHIYTMDRDYPDAEAIAVKGSVIMDIGSAEDVESLAGKNTEVIDLDGAYIMPGFINTVSMMSPQLMARVLPPERMHGKTPEEIQEILDKLDIPRIQSNVLAQAEEFSKAGFTTVFAYGAPMIFEDIYQQVLMMMLQEGMSKQRTFASASLGRDINAPLIMNILMQRNANCQEVDDLLNYEALRLVVNSENENGFTEEGLTNLALAAAERDFTIVFEALDKGAALMCLSAIEAVRATGSKSHLLFYHEVELAEEDYPEILDESEYVEIKSLAKCGENALFENVKGLSNEEAFEKLTIDAARTLNIEDLCGSLDIDKSADFAVFKEDPYKTELSKLKAEMVVLAGSQVYAKDSDFRKEWQEAMSEYYEFLDEEEFGAKRAEAELAEE